MKNFSLVLILILTFPVKAITESEGKDIAPPQTYRLTIDGVSHEISPNNLEEIQIAQNKHVIKLVKNKTRVFNQAGTTFEFDSNLHFSYEELSIGLDQWSLDGNNAVIMVQKYHLKVNFKKIIEAYRSQFAQMKADIKISETEILVNNRVKKGKKLDINLGDIKLEQQIFYYSDNHSSVLLILQDSLLDSGENSDEFEKMKKLLQTTLSVSI